MHKGLKTSVCFGVVTTMLTASAFAGGYPLVPNNNNAMTPMITSIQKTAATIENESAEEEKIILEEEENIAPSDESSLDTSKEDNAADDDNISDDASLDTSETDNTNADDNVSDDVALDTSQTDNTTADDNISDDVALDTSETDNTNADDNISNDVSLDTSQTDNTIADDNISNDVALDTSQTDNTTADDNISNDVALDTSEANNTNTDDNISNDALLDMSEEYEIMPLLDEEPEIEPLSLTADDFTVTLPGQAVYNGKAHEAQAKAKTTGTDAEIEILYKRLPDTKDSIDSVEKISTDAAQSEETADAYNDEPITAGQYQVALLVQDMLFTNKDWVFPIQKAERTLNHMPTGSMLLYSSTVADTISQTLQVTVSSKTDVDQSAEVKYSIYTVGNDAKAITLTTNQDKATVKAVDNGVVKIAVTVPETVNYKEKQALLSVCAVAKPLLGVTVTSSVADDPVTAAYDEQKKSIVVSGVKSANAVLTYHGQTPTIAGTIITAVCKNSVMTVTVGGHIAAAYTIDESKVGTRTDGIQVIESAAPKFTVASSITNQSVKDAMNSNHVQISNLLQATAASLQETAKRLKTDDVESVTIEVCPAINAEAYSGSGVDSTIGRLTLNVTPQYTIMVVKKNGVISTNASNLQDSQLSVPLRVAVPLPDSLRAKRHLIAKQTKNDGEIKYLPVTIETKNNRTVASWMQDGCGKVEIIGNDTAYVVQFNNTENGSGVTSGVYYISDIGTRFPSVKNGANTSSIAWELSNSKNLYYSVTEEFLSAVAAEMAKNSEHIAVLTPVFTTNSIPGVSGVDTSTNIISVGGESVAGGGVASQPSAIHLTQTEHGKVTLNPSNAAKDTVVTITGQPEEDYYMIGIAVQDSAGASVSVKNIGENQYTFVMPDGEVTVSVEFQQLSDVPNDAYYHDAVRWAVSRGVTNGAENTRFAPDRSCTRAQLVTFLWRMNGCPTPAGSDQLFTDVTDETLYYYQAVQWAVEQGITTGKTASTFCPDDEVTRGQTVTFLYRAAGSPALPDDSADVAFTDVTSSAFYRDAVQWAAANGIATGSSSTTFNPDEYCTRAQAVTLLYRQQNQQ